MSDDLLAVIDQGAAAGTRATGRNSLIQAVWVYDHPVDLQGLEKFRQALTRGLLGRRLVASALPFGPDRWVQTCAAPQIAEAATARPRSEIDAWVDERAAVPINPWSGPGWHLGVLPLTDGGSAVTLVVSHVLADGVGVATAIAEAVSGVQRQLPYPRAAAAWRSIPRDLGRAIRQIPAVIGAVVAATRLATERLAPGGGEQHAVGAERWSITHIDRGRLAARAAELGGTETSMLFGVSAAVAADLGWVRPDNGHATLALSVNRRAPADLRGNAIVDAEIEVDPSVGAAGISDIRRTVRETLTALPDSGRFDVFGPLIPLLPRSVVASLIDAEPDPSRPVTTCAGVGSLPTQVTTPDGNPADRTWFRLAWSALPGWHYAPRPPYLYLGWTTTQSETSLFVATNLGAAHDLGGTVAAAVERLLTPSDSGVEVTQIPTRESGIAH